MTVSLSFSWKDADLREFEQSLDEDFFPEAFGWELPKCKLHFVLNNKDCGAYLREDRIPIVEFVLELKNILYGLAVGQTVPLFHVEESGYLTFAREDFDWIKISWFTNFEPDREKVLLSELKTAVDAFSREVLSELFTSQGDFRGLTELAQERLAKSRYFRSSVQLLGTNIADYGEYSRALLDFQQITSLGS